MSKELFEIMRANELVTMYDQSFTKKEAIATGKKLVESIFENGEVEPMEIWANIARLKEVINSADAEFRLKTDLFEKQNYLGVEFNYVNGGNTINYDDDEIYKTLKQDLKDREELLKLAQKQPSFDAYGNEVPKVSTTPRKSSITLKF